jgi:hypothetical protein
MATKKYKPKKKSTAPEPTTTVNDAELADLIAAMNDRQTELEAATASLELAEQAVVDRDRDYNTALAAFAAAKESADQEAIDAAAEAVEIANGDLTLTEAAAGEALSNQVAAIAALRQAQSRVWSRIVLLP